MPTILLEKLHALTVAMQELGERRGLIFVDIVHSEKTVECVVLKS